MKKTDSMSKTRQEGRPVSRRCLNFPSHHSTSVLIPCTLLEKRKPTPLRTSLSMLPSRAYPRSAVPVSPKSATRRAKRSQAQDNWQSKLCLVHTRYLLFNAA
ncbi:unnamed protein product [Ectocarpus sp. 13 AM-2016]